MKKCIQVFFVIVLCVLSSCFLSGCNKPGTDKGTGSDINTGWEVTDIPCNGTVLGGTFKDSSGRAWVYIADGQMSPCVNATEKPIFESTLTLPDGLTIDSDAGDKNVTIGGSAYTFDIKGDRGFSATAEGAVTITMPFETKSISLSDETNSTRIFIRLLEQDGNFLVDIRGAIVNDSITVGTNGLPKKFTAAVIYNQNMESVSSGDDGTSTPDMERPIFQSDQNTGTGTALQSSTFNTRWPAEIWCAIYNVADSVLQDQIKIIKNITTEPSVQDIREIIKQKVTDWALQSQRAYETAGFLKPNLYIASQPSDLGSELGVNKRYIIELQNIDDQRSFFVPEQAGEARILEFTRYGRLVLAYNNINSLDIVPHEMLHAVQNSYLPFGDTTCGYWEGTATLYGLFQGNSGTIAVATGLPEYTFLLSDYLMIGSKQGSYESSYSNQDFFAYVARKYNANRPGYISDLFAELAKGVNQAAAINEKWKVNPPRWVLLDAMSESFKKQFGLPLWQIYLDFVRQRAFAHSPESQFGRKGEEHIPGWFAENLFQKSDNDALNAVKELLLSNNNITGSVQGKFTNVAPYAARAIKLLPLSEISTTGLTVSVKLKSSESTIGELWEGFSCRNNRTTPLIAEETTFSNVAESVVIVIANVNSSQPMSIEYEVTCKKPETTTTTVPQEPTTSTTAKETTTTTELDLTTTTTSIGGQCPSGYPVNCAEQGYPGSCCPQDFPYCGNDGMCHTQPVTTTTAPELTTTTTFAFTTTTTVPTEYLVWYTKNVCCWGAPFIYISDRERFDSIEYAADFIGGGNDRSVILVKAEMQGGFGSYAEAQAWLCPQFVTHFHHYWCGTTVQTSYASWQLGDTGCDISNLPDAVNGPDVDMCLTVDVK
jgi:predicted small secreted protein